MTWWHTYSHSFLSLSHNIYTQTQTQLQSRPENQWKKEDKDAVMFFSGISWLRELCLPLSFFTHGLLPDCLPACCLMTAIISHQGMECICLFLEGFSSAWLVISGWPEVVNRMKSNPQRLKAASQNQAWIFFQPLRFISWVACWEHTPPDGQGSIKLALKFDFHPQCSKINCIINPIASQGFFSSWCYMRKFYSVAALNALRFVCLWARNREWEWERDKKTT